MSELSPVWFDEATGTLSGGPAEKYGSDVKGLPVHRSGDQVISCWEVSRWERLKLLFSGKIWLHVLTRTAHHPVCLSTSNPFEGAHE